MKKYLLLFGVSLTLVAHFVAIDTNLQLYFLVIALLLTGVPHGSLDYFVEEQNHKLLNQKFSLPNFLVKYLFNMVAYAIFWFLFPTMALIIFIGLTAFHFGEIDWPVRNNSKLHAILYTLYGLEIIVFIITSHINEAAPILELIVKHNISDATWIITGSSIWFVCLVCMVINAILLIAFYKILKWDKKDLLFFLAQSLMLCLIVYQLPLYLSFGFYFGFWHSGLSFNLIRKQMNLADTIEGWFNLIKRAIPFTLIAWLGIFILILLSSQIYTQLLILTNLFIGISILSLPHLQVFTKIKSQ